MSSTELASWRADESLGAPKYEGHNAVQMSHLHHSVSTMDRGMCACLNDSEMCVYRGRVLLLSMKALYFCSHEVLNDKKLI